MNPFSYPETQNTRDVVAYFTRLGYKVSWDMNTREGIRWHEIIDADNNVVAQVTHEVSLAALHEDMICWHEGRDGTSDEDYVVHVGEIGNPLAKILYRKVAENPI